MGSLSILLWTVGLPVALAILYLAHVGLQHLLEGRKWKAFIGSDRTAAIPCADTTIRHGKVAAIKTDEDFVIFFLGATVHHWWDLRMWALLSSMPKMLKELTEDPSNGYLGGYYYSGNPLLFVQYWRSVDHLLAYAGNPKKSHYPTWCKLREAWKQAEQSGRSFGLGLYHETFKVRGGEYEGVYSEFPPFGVGRLFGLTAATGAYKNARKRMEFRPPEKGVASS